MKSLIHTAMLMGLALTVGACCGAAASTKQTPATCLKEKGCPPPEALPVCAPAGEALDLQAALAAAPEQLGAEISVKAPLRRAGTVCTLLLCQAGQCCNNCGASLVLSNSEKPDHMEPGSLSLYYDKAAPGGKSYSCGGDDSLVCCSARADGQAVVATGKIKVLGEGAKGTIYGLSNARLCVPPTAVQIEEQ